MAQPIDKEAVGRSLLSEEVVNAMDNSAQGGGAEEAGAVDMMLLG